MPKAHLKMANKKSLYLYSTEVENIFLNEFLPTAPGDFVKVYLFCLMYAQHDLEITYSEMSRLMGLTQEEIEKAWKYWAAVGLVNLIKGENGDTTEIEFVSLKDKLFGSHVKAGSTAGAQTGVSAGGETEAGEKTETAPVQNGKYSQDDEDRFNQVINAGISELYSQYAKYAEAEGRTVSQKELKIIADAIKVYNVTPDVMSYAIKYCAEELRKCHAAYMYTVARRWTDSGCRTIDQVREVIDEYSKRNDHYQAIFRQMGFMRTPGPGDREMMDRWLDEMGFSIGDVLEACRKSAGLREPNLRYVDKILENWMRERGGIDTRIQNPQKVENKLQEKYRSSESGTEAQREPALAVSKVVLEEYYNHLRNESANLQKARVAEMCGRWPEMKRLFELDDRLKSALLGGGIGKEERQKLRSQKKELENEKKKILVENGFSEDYLDRKYKCSVCRDTGLTDAGRICSCRKLRVEEAYKWNQERNQK